jgi:hypothetical protein
MFGIRLSLRTAQSLSILIVLVIVLAGCGGGDAGSQGSQSASQGTPAPGATIHPSTMGNSSEGQVATVTVAPTTAPPATDSEMDWSKVDACKLLTAQDLEPVVGAIDEDPKPDPDIPASDGKASCRYRNSEKGFRAFLVIGSPTMWDSEHDSAVDGALNPQSLSGVGDDAFIVGHSLTARWRGKGITVDLSLLNVEAPFDTEQAKQLVLKAFARLP